MAGTGDPTLAFDEAAHRRGWAAQRVAWVVMSAVVVMAVLGVFGSGPVATGRARAGDALEVHYARFARRGAQAELRVDVRARASREGLVRVGLGRDFVEGVQLERVTPRPDRMEAGAEGVVLAFRAAGTPGVPFPVRVEYRPRALGLRTGAVTGVEGGPTAAVVRFRQLVYP